MLQKIKKIGIVALVIFILTGATYFLFNLYSKSLIQRHFEKLFNKKCTIIGYRFNLFGKLSFEELKLGDALFVKNFTLKYKPFLLVLSRTINSIHIDGFTVYPEKFKRPGGEKGLPSLTLAMPVQISEIKINKGTVVLDTNKIELNLIYIAGEGTIKTYRIRTYINNISYNGENLYFYTDVILKNNIILIKDLEIQNGKVSISGTSGAIYLPDSAKIKVSSVKFLQNSAKDLEVLYYVPIGKFFLNTYEITIQGQTLKEAKAEIQQKLPDSLLIQNVSFKYRENTINGSGVYLIKKGKLTLRNIEVSLNELGLEGNILSTLEYQKGQLYGKINSKNLRYFNSESFEISCNLYLNGKGLQVEIDYIKSRNSKISGKITLANQTINLFARGTLSIPDIFRDQGGNVDLKINYSLSRGKRNGHILFVAKKLSYENINCDELLCNLFSKGQIDSIKMQGKGVTISNIKLDSLSSEVISEEFKRTTITFAAFEKSHILNGTFLLSHQGDKSLNFQVSALQLLLGDSDTIQIRDPLNISRQAENLILHEGKVFVNSSPILLKGTLDLNSEGLEVKFSIDNVNVNNLKGIKSTFAGEIEINGNLKSPRVEAWLRGNNFNYKDYKNLNLYAVLKVYEGNLTLDTISIYGPSTDLVLSGSFPLTFTLRPFIIKPKPHASYRVITKVRALPIEKLSDLTQKQLILNSLDLLGEIQIDGTYDSNPNLSGFLRAENIAGIYTPIQMEFSKGEIFVELVNDGFKIKKGIVTVDHGTVNISGYGKKLFEKDKEIYLSFSGTNITLYPTYNIFASGDAMLSVIIKGDDITVKGNALVKEATIFQSIRPAGGTSSHPPKNLNLVLNLHSEGNTFFVNELADIEIKGNLVFQITDGRMLLDGTADVVKGYFLYLDRIFEIQSGYVNFNSTTSLEPEFNLQAMSKVDTFTIYLALSGTMRSPHITLTSEPPLNELNIIYLLTLGRLYGDTASTSVEELQELKNRAFSLASAFISQNLRRTLRFQELRIANTETTENPALLIGLYLNPRLYLWYSHDMFDITKDMFRIRYKITTNLGVFAERDQERRLLIGLDYLYEF